MANPDFDERAATWDDEPERRDHAHAVADLVRAAVPLSPDARVLDYGAGTGLLSEGLVGHVGHLTLADPSAGMRTVAEAKVAEGLLAGASVVDLDLSRDPVPDLEVDLIVTMMALHHIHDLPRVLGGFAALLPAGGSLAVIDLEEDVEASFHDEGFDGHHGFRRDHLGGLMVAAGFAEPVFSHALTLPKEEREYELFLAVTHRLGVG